MVSRRQVLQMVSGVSVASLAGCFGGSEDGPGGGGGDNGTTEPAGIQRTTRRPSVIGTSTAASEYPSYDWALLDDADITNTDSVTISDDSGTLLFEPRIARVPPGTTITWENTTTGRHTITIPKTGFDEFIFGGNTVEVTFDEPGVFNYLCKNHSPEHIGRIVVDESLTPYPGSDETATGTEGGVGTDGDTATDTSG